MYGPKSAAVMIVVVTTIFLGPPTAPAVTATSGDHSRSPEVFHCC